MVGPYIHITFEETLSFGKCFETVSKSINRLKKIDDMKVETTQLYSIVGIFAQYNNKKLSHEI